MWPAVALSAAAFAAVLCASADEVDQLFDIADEDFRPITRPLDRPAFYHSKRLTVTEESLADGWVENLQCHRHFSRTKSLDVVFPPGKIRSIEITETEGIGAIETGGHGVSLQDVGPNSRLCFRSEIQVLHRNGGDDYQLRAGPFYYRFLDGYFPTEVRLLVRFPASLLAVRSVSPQHGSGVQVVHDDGTIHVSSVFEGKLWVNIVFGRRR